MRHATSSPVLRLSVSFVLAGLLLVGCDGESGRPGDGPAPTSGGESAPSLAWSQPRGGPGHAGATTEPGPTELPAILWTYFTEAEVTTEPVRALAPGGGELLLVASGKEIRAVDPDTGAVLWSHVLFDILNASPFAVGDAVVAASMAGELVRLRLSDGELLEDEGLDFPVSAHAIGLGGSVLVQEWSVSAAVPESALRVLDATTLRPSWTVEYPRALDVAPASDGRLVYVHGSEHLRAWNAADGSPAWEHAYARRTNGLGPQVADGRVLVLRQFRTHDWTAHAHDSATGDVLWEAELPGHVALEAALAAEELIVPLQEGELVRLGLADGSLVGRHALPAAPSSPPVVTPGHVFIGVPGAVLALERGSWTESWRLELDGEIVWLAVRGDQLLAVSSEGYLHCLGT